MKKVDFNKATIEEYNLDPLSKHLFVQNKKLQEENSLLQETNTSTLYEYGDLVLDQLEHKAYYKNEDLMLANREYDVLLYFCNHPNEIISFEAMGNYLFGYYSDADKQSVVVNVNRFRKKISSYLYLSNHFENIRGVGYKFTI